MFAYDVCILVLLSWCDLFHQFTSFGSPCGRNDKRRVYCF